MTKECNHNWATYDPTPGYVLTIYHPNGDPKYQICAKCYKKRTGWPQPMKFEYDEEDE